jgi:hypothetical protein
MGVAGSYRGRDFSVEADCASGGLVGRLAGAGDVVLGGARARGRAEAPPRVVTLPRVPVFGGRCHGVTGDTEPCRAAFTSAAPIRGAAARGDGACLPGSSDHRVRAPCRCHEQRGRGPARRGSGGRLDHARILLSWSPGRLLPARLLRSRGRTGHAIADSRGHQELTRSCRQGRSCIYTWYESHLPGRGARDGE